MQDWVHTMDDIRQDLIRLGPERLADALLELSASSDAADDLVTRLTATPEENTQSFKKRLAAIKRRKHFIDWREAATYASELAALLEDLKAANRDPLTGVKLVAAFYEADEAIFEQCDDSNGNVGDIFCNEACELFVSYASRCQDKESLLELLLRLLREDPYGVRETLIDCAGQYLPEEVMRQLAERLWRMAKKESDQFRARCFFLRVESLARQLKDAALFEKACRAACPELPVAACLDIAKVWLETGNAETSLAWLERIPEKETFNASERDCLLLTVYKKLGAKDKTAETAWRIFRNDRSEKHLAALLTVIGKDKREKVIEDEVRLILQSDRLSYSDADFLVDLKRMDAAEAYLLRWINRLDGDFYRQLLPLAQSMERSERFLTASVLYRVLLDSILKQAASKYYHHGVRYLKKLDKLADMITDWKNIVPHDAYKAGLRQTHGRKHSFWSRYKR